MYAYVEAYAPTNFGGTYIDGVYHDACGDSTIGVYDQYNYEGWSDTRLDANYCQGGPEYGTLAPVGYLGARASVYGRAANTSTFYLCTQTYDFLMNSTAAQNKRASSQLCGNGATVQVCYTVAGHKWFDTGLGGYRGGENNSPELNC